MAVSLRLFLSERKESASSLPRDRRYCTDFIRLALIFNIPIPRDAWRPHRQRCRYISFHEPSTSIATTKPQAAALQRRASITVSRLDDSNKRIAYPVVGGWRSISPTTNVKCFSLRPTFPTSLLKRANAKTNRCCTAFVFSHG